MSKPVYRHHFDSLGAAVSVASNPAIKPIFTRKLSSQAHDDSGWHGSNTFDDAVTMARYGWKDGAVKMTGAVASIAAQNNIASRPSYSFDVAGAYPIAAMAAAGEAHCMISPIASIERARPTVRLGIIASVSALVTSNEITNYGAVLLSVIDALEQNDFRCEISLVYGMESMYEKTSISFITVRIKEASDILDLDRMAFCIASPAMYRRIVFSLMEKHLKPEYESGYGVPYTPKPKDFPDLTLIPSAQAWAGQLRTPKDAMGAVLPTIQEALAGTLETLPEIFATRTA